MLFLINFNPLRIEKQNVHADPFIVREEGIGGIFPDNETNLQMTEASVIMDIDETSGREGDFRIFFDGNYTIYNPEDTKEVTIAAPFFSFYDIENTLRIDVEGKETVFEIIQDFYYEYEPEQEIDRKYAIIRANLSGYSSTFIHYSFVSTIFGYNPKGVVNIMIIYEVGTARVWDGVITETVEFRVLGKQPHYYTEYPRLHNNSKLSITDFVNGKSYEWSWEETIIEDPWVFVSYLYDPFAKTNFISIYLLVSSIFVLAILTSYGGFRKSNRTNK